MIDVTMKQQKSGLALYAGGNHFFYCAGYDNKCHLSIEVIFGDRHTFQPSESTGYRCCT